MTPEKLRPAFTFTEDRLRQLQQVAPEAFADGKINWETLREALGNYLEDEEACEEHFGLFWPGKRQARRLAAMPPKGTLVPAPGEGVNEEKTHHVFIEGENLEVLKLLQKSYAGRVKMIYIDPPYNTGKDFIYPDDYSEPLEAYLKRTGQMDEEGRRLTTNTRASGRFHSNWLNMMYPRLLLARQLLREDGVIFVSIDDNEAHNLRSILDELFGMENFIAQFVWEGGRKNDSKFVSISHDYILCYAKNKELLQTNKSVWRTRKEGIDKIYRKVEGLRSKFGADYEAISQSLREWYQQLSKNDPAWQHRHYNRVDEKGVFFPGDISWPGGGGPKYPVLHPHTKKPVRVPARGWVFSKPETMEKAIQEGRVLFGPDENKVPTLKRYLHETEGQVLASVIYKDRRSARKRLRLLFGIDGVFPNPKDEDVIRKLVEATTNEQEIVMDFFAGSCTTAHAVLQQNSEDGGRRRFIMVQLPEPLDPAKKEHKAAIAFCDQIGKPRNIAEIGKERIRRVIAKMQAEREGQLEINPDEDLGFKVFKLQRSHFKAWQPVEPTTPQALDDLFSQHASPLVEGWEPQALLTEILLLEGFPLDSAIVPLDETFPANTVWRVHHPDVSHELFVCLDETLAEDTVARLKAGDLLRDEDIFICLDAALTDEAKVVLDDRLRLKVI